MTKPDVSAWCKRFIGLSKALRDYQNHFGRTAAEKYHPPERSIRLIKMTVSDSQPTLHVENVGKKYTEKYLSKILHAWMKNFGWSEKVIVSFKKEVPDDD